MSKYKTFEELKKELGDNYDKFMYEMNLELVKQKEKAIEYIKDLCYIESENKWFTYGDDLSPEHIVSILQGEDKE